MRRLPSERAALSEASGEETAGRHWYGGAARWTYGDMEAASGRLERGRGNCQRGTLFAGSCLTRRRPSAPRAPS
jgi:hypothetical protein